MSTRIFYRSRPFQGQEVSAGASYDAVRPRSFAQTVVSGTGRPHAQGQRRSGGERGREQRGPWGGHRRDDRSSRRRPLHRHVDTANADFGLLVTLLFRLCQLKQQLQNWFDLLPRAVDKSVDALFDSIGVARPDDILANRMFETKEILKSDLRSTVVDHCVRQISATNDHLSRIDATDKNEAADVARLRLIRLNKRIDRDDMGVWLRDALAVVGTESVNAPNNSSIQTRSAAESRPRSTVANAEQQTAMTSTNTPARSNNTITVNNNAQQAGFTTVNNTHTQRKRQLPTSPPGITLQNRFEGLAGDVEEGRPTPGKLRKTERPPRLDAESIDDIGVLHRVEVLIHREPDDAMTKFVTDLIQFDDACVTDTTTNVNDVRCNDVHVSVSERDPDGRSDGAATWSMHSSSPCSVASVNLLEADTSDVTGTNLVQDGLAERPTVCPEPNTSTDGGLTYAEVARSPPVRSASQSPTQARGSGLQTAQMDRDRTLKRFSFTRPIDRRCPSAPTQTVLKDPAAADKPEIRYGARVYKAPSAGLKTLWTLKTGPACKTVVIGDSNLKLGTTADPCTEIHAFCGAKLTHAVNLLKDATLAKNVKTVVVAVGINNRNLNFAHTTSDNLKKLALAANQLRGRNVEVYFAGVSIGSRGPEDPVERQNIGLLNDEARRRFAQRYISPLPESEIGYHSSGNPEDIHHNGETVSKVINSILEFVESRSRLN